MLSREFIGIEIDPKYFEIAKARIDGTESGVTRENWIEQSKKLAQEADFKELVKRVSSRKMSDGDMFLAIDQENMVQWVKEVLNNKTTNPSYKGTNGI